MKKIEVAVLAQMANPEGNMAFLARLTQRSHNIQCMHDLIHEYNYCITKTDWKSTKSMVRLPHGTIKRTTPVTIAIVGASRRFLAQVRTHNVGLTFVSGSLQYSDYSGKTQDNFVVPYPVIEKGLEYKFLAKCELDQSFYENLIADGLDNDSAGYTMNQAMRNILIMSGNHEAFDTFLGKRLCRRNTPETQYVAALIWKALYESDGGELFFSGSGADCMTRKCREGKMFCGTVYKPQTPDEFIKLNWPLLSDTDGITVIKEAKNESSDI